MIIHGKKTSIIDVQQWAQKLGGKLISLEYKDMLTKMEWVCSLGHQFSTTFNHVKNRGQWCPICGKTKKLHSLKHRMSSQEIRTKISKSHLKRLSKENKFAGKTQREIASRIRDHLTGLIRCPAKHKSILSLLGCSIEEFKLHLESKFEDGMTWENRGQYGWHIDHVKPLSSFDLTNLEQLKQACHYTNLQPLWWQDNLVKSYK